MIDEKINAQLCVDAKTGCVVLITCRDYLSEDAMQKIKNQVNRAFPFNSEIVVLNGGITLNIINPPDETTKE